MALEQTEPSGPTVVLDPTSEQEAAELPLAPALEGAATVALLDIRKPRGDIFLDELERLLAEKGHRVQRTAKPTFTKTAPPDVRAEIAASCDAVIEALAD
jgi:hypothetical protein